MKSPSQTFTAIDELLQRSRKHMHSEEFKKFIEFLGRFPDYAYFNRMLVYLQNPEVTLFGSHTFWQSNFNRKVRDDAKPYIVLVPFGPVGLVFDIMDTEGYVSPEDLLNEVTNGGPFSVKGSFTEAQLEAVIKEAYQWGIEVIYIPANYFLAGNVRKFGNGKITIGLNKNLGPAENFATLLHEMGHLFAGHLGGMQLTRKREQQDQQDQQNQQNQQNQKKKTRKEHVSIFCHYVSKDAEEIEAETISWLICRRFGIGTKSAEYLAKYNLSAEVLSEISRELMIKVADMIFQLFCKDLFKLNGKIVREEKEPFRNLIDIFS